MSTPSTPERQSLEADGAAAVAHLRVSSTSSASGGGGIAGDSPLGGLASPMGLTMRAVEPVIMQTDEEDGGEEEEPDEQKAAGLRMLPSVALTPQPSASPSSGAVEEPPSSSDDEEDDASVAAAAAAAGPVPAYSTHLWHGVPAVLSQLAQGRTASSKLESFLAAKSALDRSYAASLRKLNNKWSTDMNLPIRPALNQTHTVVAALCALRNCVANTARNQEMLADKLEEQVREKFLDEAQAREEELEDLGTESQAKKSCKKLEKAMEHLAETKKAAKECCNALADAKIAAANDEMFDPPSTSSSSKKSTSESWMSELVGFTAGAFSKKKSSSSAVADLSRKLPGLDTKYVLAIKAARAARAEFDVSIAANLASLEKAERARLASVKDMASTFLAMHSQCLAASLKNHTASLAVVKDSRPAQDLDMFIRETVRKSAGRIEPPPLPVYRLFRGHPNYVSPNNPSVIGSSSSKRQRASKVGGASSSSRRSRERDAAGGDEPHTDSDADAEDIQEDELQLSDATDSDGDADDAAEEDQEEAEEEEEAANAAADAQNAEETQDAFSPPPSDSSAAHEAAEQMHAEAAFTLLFESLILHPHASASEEHPSPIEQAQLSAAQDLLQTAGGRVALAAVLKRVVTNASSLAAAVTVATNANKAASAAAEEASITAEQQQQQAEEDLLNTSSSLDGLEAELELTAVEPMALQPTAASAASAAEPSVSMASSSVSSSSTASSSSSHSSASSHLVLSAASFNQLATLLLRLLDACEATIHAQPAMSVLRTARRVFTPAVPAAVVDAEDAVQAAPQPQTCLLSLLSSHPACCSLRLWELAFFESLSRSRARHAPLHKWQTDAEHRAQEGLSARLTVDLLDRYARDMQSLSLHAISDEQVVKFVDKFAQMQQLSPEQMAMLVDRVAAFKRVGLTEMPSMAQAKLKTPKSSTTTTTTTTTTKFATLPVAMPVGAAASTDSAAVDSPSPTHSDPALSPSASPTSATALSPSPARPGASALHGARPPFVASASALSAESKQDMP